MTRQMPEEVRRLIDRGLARYGRGEFSDAIVEWEGALGLDPQNEEARNLLEFVRAKLPTPQADDGWSAREDTDAESAVQTAARVHKAEHDAVNYIRRATVVSPIPQFLSAITAPDWAGGAERDDAAPVAEIQNEPTRRVGGDDLETTAERAALAVKAAEEMGGKKRRGTPADGRRRKSTALEAARSRAVELIEACRGDLDRGEVAAAVWSALQALREAENAPSPGLDSTMDPARPLFEQAFERFLDARQKIPILVLGPEALPKKDFDHRAAAILLNIDGAMTVQHLLDRTGLPRFEAMRIMAALVRARAIKLL